MKIPPSWEKGLGDAANDVQSVANQRNIARSTFFLRLKFSLRTVAAHEKMLRAERVCSCSEQRWSRAYANIHRVCVSASEKLDDATFALPQG